MTMTMNDYDRMKNSQPLDHKIDFVVIFSVTNANSNGDPGAENLPRTDSYGHAEMSSVCSKRKIRNRMQDLGYINFVQPDDRNIDGYDTLKARADAVKARLIAQHEAENGKKSKKPTITAAEFTEAMCKEYLDVRTFGQVFAFSGEDGKKGSGVSIPVRGPVTVHIARTVDPVEIASLQISKSCSGDKKDGENRSSDTFGGSISVVRFGLFVLKGSISVELANKYGFTKGDAEVLKECLRTMFVGDASNARPDGSMAVHNVYWAEHDCALGQYSAQKVHNLVHAELKEPGTIPTSIDDYEITLGSLPGLNVEVIEGF